MWCDQTAMPFMYIMFILPNNLIMPILNSIVKTKNILCAKKKNIVMMYVLRLVNCVMKGYSQMCMWGGKIQ